jgi:glycosyltransferase involved in cell wall biosynthesis
VAVSELLDDRALAARVGARARELMLSHFSVDTMVDNIARVYAEAA